MFFLRSDFPEPVGHKSAPILLFSVHELPPLLMLLPEKQLHLFLDTLSSIVRGRYLPGHILYRFVLVASRQWLSDVLLLILIPDCESAFACYLLLLFLLLYHISENFLPSLSGFRGAFQVQIIQHQLNADERSTQKHLESALVAVERWLKKSDDLRTVRSRESQYFGKEKVVPHV